MEQHITRPSDRALECFVHGVAHLIDEQGYLEGLVTADRLLSYLESAPTDLKRALVRRPAPPPSGLVAPGRRGRRT